MPTPKSYLSALIFSLVAFVSVAQSIVRGPYLQAATASSIVIRWRTDSPTNSVVRFGADKSNLSQSVTDLTATTEHEIKLPSLQSATTYFYSIGTTDKTQAEGLDYYFTTSLPKGNTSKIRLWAMGDMGDGSPNQLAVRDAYLRYTQNNNFATNAILMLGDNAYGSGTDLEYQNSFFNIYQNYFFRNTTFWTIPGNHEYYSGSQYEREVAYFKMFSPPQQGEAGGVASETKMYYSFDIANVHIIALDSYGIEEGKYRLSDTLGPQVQWLKKDLAANHQPWTIVMFHHPPYTKNSHDSDAEAELVAIRQNLTPILERYGVDLVLSGHSHLYERSRLMRGHIGMSYTFDEKKNLFTTSSGRYDGQPNSCAYIKNTGQEGTIYTVIGSSGRLNGFDGVAHPAMPYKNVTIGGSGIIEIEDKRLDFKWLGSDDIVYDQFTIFKNTLKTDTLSVKHGDIINLTASWKGSYKWNDSNDKSSFSTRILNDTLIRVTDNLGCLEDKFYIKLIAKPIIKVQNIAKTVCLGEKISLPFEAKNTNSALWQYKIELSDSKGEFINPIQIGTVQNDSAKVIIPTNIPAGNNYKLRVVANTSSIASTISEAFTVAHQATATISGNTTINAGKTADLTIALTGTPPWSIELSDGHTKTSSTSPIVVNVNPLVNTVYKLKSVNNICGVGAIDGSTQIIVIPYIKAVISAQQTICNDSEVLIDFEQIGQFDKPIQYIAQLSDSTGSFANAQNIGSNKESPIKGKIPLLSESGSNYKMRILPADGTMANIINSSPFKLFKKASAVIKGDTTIQFGEKATLKLNFVGSAPWTYTLSDNASSKTNLSSVQVSVSPTMSTTYTLKSVENICGIGESNGKAQINILITSTSPISSEWHVYPNPFSSYLTIQPNKPLLDFAAWEIIDASGKCIKKGVVYSHYTINTVDTKDLTMGSYTIYIRTPFEVISEKIIK